MAKQLSDKEIEERVYKSMRNLPQPGGCEFCIKFKENVKVVWILGQRYFVCTDCIQLCKEKKCEPYDKAVRMQLAYENCMCVLYKSQFGKDCKFPKPTELELLDDR